LGYLDLWGKIRERQSSVVVPALTSTSTGEVPIFVAPFKCTIQSIIFVPYAAITGNNTNSFEAIVNIVDEDGVLVNQATSKAFLSGEDLVAFQSLEIDVVTNKELEKGEVLTLQKTSSGGGLTMPAMLVIVNYRQKGGL
jgi:hypothetical protein